jgi:hypothetical protein
MDGSLHAQSRPQGSGTLFGEDFDIRESAPEPEVIEPVFSTSDVASAREFAWRDGHAAGVQEATESDVAIARHMLEAIAEAMAASHDAAAVHAEQAAEAIAHLLLDSLAAAFPALCANYGDAEIRALVRIVLPPLSDEPAITVRANPRMISALAIEMRRLDPDLTARVQIHECDGLAPGDVRVTWHNGAATRDAAGLWEQVAMVLAPAGLRPQINEMVKETTDGD